MLTRIGLVGILIVILVLLITSAGDGATAKCDLYASPHGSDTASGTSGSPLRSPQKLADSLRAGQTGCLRQGTYNATTSTADYQELRVTQPNIKLASAPGELAEIVGRVYVVQGANGDTFENLVLNGRNSKVLPSPTVDAANTIFLHDEVTNEHTGICFGLGSSSYGEARGTILEDNVVHACGEQPSTNLEHGIYVADATGTVIRGNWIYDNVDRGVQLYPDAQGTVVTGNVIYGNGEGMIFSGDANVAASNSTVTHNVIADSRIRGNVESYYEAGGPIGTNNQVRENCVFGAASSFYAGSDGSGIQQPEVGFVAAENVVANPAFADVAAADFRMTGNSSCAAQLTAPVDGLLPGPVVASGETEEPGETETEGPGEPEPEEPGEAEPEAPAEEEKETPPAEGEGSGPGSPEAEAPGSGTTTPGGPDDRATATAPIPSAVANAEPAPAPVPAALKTGPRRLPKVLVDSGRLRRGKLRISSRAPASAPCQRVRDFARVAGSWGSLAGSVNCIGGQFDVTVHSRASKRVSAARPRGR